MNKSLYALSRPIQPRQKSVSLRVAFCDDAADERKNGHACHSLIRFNSRMSVNAAKKAKCRYHLACGIIAIIIDNFVQNRANYRPFVRITSVIRYFSSGLFVTIGYFDRAVVA